MLEAVLERRAVAAQQVREPLHVRLECLALALVRLAPAGMLGAAVSRAVGLICWYAGLLCRYARSAGVDMPGMPDMPDMPDLLGLICPICSIWERACFLIW